jgi:hypothetical protein
MDPTEAEAESKIICKHLVYLSNIVWRLKISSWVTRGATDTYGVPEKVCELTRMLCDACKDIDDSIIYNGKDKNARRLADWWDEHLEGEERREAEDAALEENEKVKYQALSKLTKEEKKALNLD